MNNDLQSLEKAYGDTVALFISEFEKWRNERLAKTDNDYLNLIMEMCEILSEKFWVSGEKLSSVLIFNSECAIEKIVIENSEKGRYRYYKSKDVTKGLTTWLLQKKGGHREMEIQLNKNNCIWCCSYYKPNWSSVGATISYKTLESFILSWAENSL